MATLPETWLVPVINRLKDDPEINVIEVAREEEAVGICMGAHLAGIRSAVIIQNHGLFACINPLVSLGALYKLPALLFVSFSGSMGENDPWHTAGGAVTEPLLEALNIPFQSIASPDLARTQIQDAQALAESSLSPVALLLTRQFMLERS